MGVGGGGVSAMEALRASIDIQHTRYFSDNFLHDIGINRGDCSILVQDGTGHFINLNF